MNGRGKKKGWGEYIGRRRWKTGKGKRRMGEYVSKEGARTEVGERNGGRENMWAE